MNRCLFFFLLLDFVLIVGFREYNIKEPSRVKKVVVSTAVCFRTRGHLDRLVTAAGFAGTFDVAVNLAGTLNVADECNGSIRETSGQHISEKSNLPREMGIDKQGNIYVADFNNNCIRKISFR